jgi:hypothetical protein
MRSAAALSAAGLLPALLGMSACGTEAASSSPSIPAAASVEPSPEPALDECSTENLTVVNPGQLTVALLGAADEPMFIDGKPGSGEGFESALVYGIADGLGFGPTQVQWLEAAPGPEVVDGVLAEGGRRADFVIGRLTGPPALGLELSDPYLLPEPGGDTYALAFITGNPLRTCVNGVLSQLALEGEIQELIDTWLASTPLSGGQAVTSVTRVS